MTSLPMKSIVMVTDGSDDHGRAIYVDGSLYPYEPDDTETLFMYLNRLGEQSFCFSLRYVNKDWWFGEDNYLSGWPEKLYDLVLDKRRGYF